MTDSTNMSHTYDKCILIKPFRRSCFTIFPFTWISMPTPDQSFRLVIPPLCWLFFVSLLGRLYCLAPLTYRSSRQLTMMVVWRRTDHSRVQCSVELTGWQTVDVKFKA